MFSLDLVLVFPTHPLLYETGVVSVDVSSIAYNQCLWIWLGIPSLWFGFHLLGVYLVVVSRFRYGLASHRLKMDGRSGVVWTPTDPGSDTGRGMALDIWCHGDFEFFDYKMCVSVDVLIGFAHFQIEIITKPF